MRTAWFEYVAKVRKRLQRKSKNKPVTHKEAMKIASINWPKEKAKLQRKMAREKRKSDKLKAQNPEPPVDNNHPTSE